MTDKFYCPECGSEEVFSTHEQAFMVNSGDHYCHMVKTQDPDSKAGCVVCRWRGEFGQLVFDKLEKAQQRKVATGVTDGSKVTIDRCKLEQALEAYLCREMPAGTVIGDPKWWVPKIANVIKEALAQPEQICGFDVVIDELMPPDTFKLAQPEQEPVAYDKKELNRFAQDLYDLTMREGKHGHYESMFHVIHQCVKKVASPQPQLEAKQ